MPSSILHALLAELLGCGAIALGWTLLVRGVHRRSPGMAFHALGVLPFGVWLLVTATRELAQCGSAAALWTVAAVNLASILPQLRLARATYRRLAGEAAAPLRPTTSC